MKALQADTIWQKKKSPLQSFCLKSLLKEKDFHWKTCCKEKAILKMASIHKTPTFYHRELKVRTPLRFREYSFIFILLKYLIYRCFYGSDLCDYTLHRVALIMF